MKPSLGMVGTALFGLAELVVGVLLLINPTGFTGLIVSAFGVVLVVLGVFDAVKYFRAPIVQAASQQNLAKGFGALLLGLFCLFQFEWITMALPVMSTVYGVAIIVGGVVKTQWAVNLLRFKRQYWYLAGIGALLSLGLGAAIVANPFVGPEAMWVFVAIVLFITAALDIAAALLGGKPKVANAPATEVKAVEASSKATDNPRVEGSARDTGTPGSAAKPQVQPRVDAGVAGAAAVLSHADQVVPVETAAVPKAQPAPASQLVSRPVEAPADSGSAARPASVPTDQNEA